MDMDMIEIKKGGKYTVYSNGGGDEPMKTEGEFVGYTILGEEGAIVFRVSNGNKKTLLRIIPVSGLFSIEFMDEDLMSVKNSDRNRDGDHATYIS